MHAGAAARTGIVHAGAAAKRRGCGPQWPPLEMRAGDYWPEHFEPEFVNGARANSSRIGRPQGACTQVLPNGLFYVILACPRGRRDRSDIHGCWICGWQQWSNMRFDLFPRTALPLYLRSGPYLARHMPLDTVPAPLTCRLLGGLFVSGQGRSACLAAGVCVWHASGCPMGVPGWSVVLSPQRSLEDRRHLIG